MGVCVGGGCGGPSRMKEKLRQDIEMRESMWVFQLIARSPL
jgi:hypothetical protein